MKRLPRLCKVQGMFKIHVDNDKFIKEVHKKG